MVLETVGEVCTGVTKTAGVFRDEGFAKVRPPRNDKEMLLNFGQNLMGKL